MSKFKAVKSVVVLIGADSFPIGVFNSESDAKQYSDEIGESDVYVIPRANLFKKKKVKPVPTQL